ncbi:MAG: hypothetical protein RMN51_03040 [Verrucomicrobiota bacterium]|nr:hypothetical protein [Limisphaera sp.]MDW8381075.1 hypothetical protein [Verrucomicrobiota bacterium]
MNFRRIRPHFVTSTIWIAVLTLTCFPCPAPAEELKLEAQLIWGTNEPKSPNPDHKPVEQKVAQKLKDLPFKWSHYFEVTRKTFTVRKNDSRQVTLSEECEIHVRQLEDDQVELTLFGKGKRVGRITQKLPKSEMLVLGGNAPNYTAWFVVLRRKD